MIDVVAAGRVEQPVVWPEPCSITVWTGEGWFTVTVMQVAFGRWGVAVDPRVNGPKNGPKLLRPVA